MLAILKTRLARIIVGASTFLFIFWEVPWIKRAVGWVTGLDFIYDKVKDPSWLGSAYRMAINPPPGTALLVAIVGLVLIYWNTKPRAVKMSWQVLGMLASFICLAGFGVAYLAGHQEVPAVPAAVPDTSSAQLTAAEKERDAALFELNVTKHQLTAKNEEWAAAMSKVQREGVAQSILLRQERLALFESNYKESASRIRGLGEFVLRDQMDMFTKPFRMGRGRMLGDFSQAVSALKESEKASLTETPEIKEVTGDQSFVLAPNENEIPDEQKRYQYRGLWHKVEQVNVWLDALGAQLKSEQRENNQAIARSK